MTRPAGLLNSYNAPSPAARKSTSLHIPSRRHPPLANPLAPSPSPQIVAFIIQNTGGGGAARPAADLPITGGFCDPFTGGGPSTSAAPPPPQPRAPAPPPSSFSITGGGVDPFTGGGGGQSSGSSGQRGSQTGLGGGLALAYLLFDQAPPAEGLGKKLREFSGQLAGDGELADVVLTAEELAAGGKYKRGGNGRGGMPGRVARPSGCYHLLLSAAPDPFPSPLSIN